MLCYTSPVPPNLRSPGGQIVVVFSGQIFALATLFAFSVITARTFGPVGLARIQITITFYTLLAMLAKMGLDEALVYRLPAATQGGKLRMPGMIGYATICCVLLCAAIGVITVIGADFIQRRLVPIPGIAADLRFAWALLPGAALASIATGALRGVGRSDVNALLSNFLGGALLMGLLAFLAWGGLSSKEAYVVRILPLLIPTALALALAIGASGERIPFTMTERGALQRVAAAAAGITLLQTLVASSDRIVASHLVSESTLGNYVVATQLVNLGLVVPGAMIFVLGPAFASALAKGDVDRADVLHAAASRWLLRGILVLYGLLIAFREEVVRLFGADYGEAPLLLAILAGGQIAANALGLNAPVLMARGRQRLELLLNGTALLVFWLGSVVLAQRWGAVGISIALSAALVVTNLLRLLAIGAAGRRLLVGGAALSELGVAVASLAALASALRWAPARFGSGLAAAAFLAVLAIACAWPTYRRRAMADLRTLLR